MIHDVRLPRETKIYLWQITRLQMDVLACAVTLLPGFSRQDLQTALAQKMSASRAERLAQWVWGPEVTDPRKIKRTRKGLQIFVTGTQQERRTLVEAMRRDVVCLFWGRCDETLVCCFDADRNLQPYQKGAKQFLVAFYDQLSSGISADLFAHNPCNYRKYGRTQFFAAYERANPNQHICAICDEHRPITILRGSYLSDIEHYFPKGIYPHLACHPYNLIPICGVCNSAHLNRDPLEDANGQRRRLGQIFLPYRSGGVLDSGVIKLNWPRNCLDSPRLDLQSKSAGAQDVMEKIAAFGAIYDIPGRWQGRIHQIGEQLWRLIGQYVRVEVGQEPLDTIRLKSELEQLLGYLVEDLGKTPWSYILIWYLSNILVEEIEVALQPAGSQQAPPILETIQEMLAHRAAGANQNRLRAKEVIEMARTLYAPPPSNP